MRYTSYRYLFNALLWGYLGLFHSSVLAEDTAIEMGLVKNGAFLLSTAPDTWRDGLKVHSLVGYLPTGTRILIEEKRIVSNIKTAEDETYYMVKSELGQSGLLREDLMVAAHGRRLAVSIASFPIQIHQPNATLDKPTKRFPLGRNGGNYLEITGETEEGFYDVVLHRAHYEGTGLPATEKARLKKRYVDKRQVSLLNPNDGVLLREFSKSWNTLVDIRESGFEGILKTIQEKAEDKLENVKHILGDINNLQCLLKGSAKGELGFKVFSNGFSIELAAELKQKGVKYLFDTKNLKTPRRNTYYSSIGIVRCDGVKPKRLQQLTVQEGIYSPTRRFTVHLEDLEKSKSKWVTTLQGNTKPTRMVKISGWEEYNQLIKELNAYATQGDGYLSEISEKQRLVLLNYIVSKIAYFEHRDLIQSVADGRESLR